MTAEEQIYAYKELKKNGQAFFVDTYEDADRIIEALEKQIPKKPDIKEKYDGLILSYYCPDCGCYYGQRGKHDIILFDKPKYCDCGQKIDWSDKKKHPEKRYQKASQTRVFSHTKGLGPERQKMHREITAIEHDGFDVRVLTVICKVPSKEFDLKEAIRKASLEYVLTPEGSKIYTHNCRCFNLADFSANVPNSICEKYGFTKLDDVYSDNEMDWDEQLVSCRRQLR